MKRQTLNAEKRKSIEGIFQSHWIEHSPYNKGLQEAKEEYNQMRPKMLQLCENIVRQYQPQQDTFEVFKMFNKVIGKVATQHEQLFNQVEEKMKKLRLGLKSYRYFDQAKQLADKLGIPLNESVLNESSSMALSVYSPENLASLLEDKVQPTREEKIAMAKQYLAQQNSLN
jgi:hypothetical protein